MRTHGLWSILLLAACGDGSDHPPVAEDDLPEAIADVICDLQQQCGCESMIPAEECRPTAAQLFEMFFAPAMEAGLTYDADCGGDGVGLYRDIGCGEIEDAVDENACRPCKLYFGGKAVGAACMQVAMVGYDDCAQGLLCDGEVCVDPCDRAAEGEACLGRSCANDLTCVVMNDGTEQTSACVRPAKLGESCMEVFCADDLICDGATVKCVAPPKVGEACNGTCAEGAWCDVGETTPWLCEAVKAEGQPCVNGEECASGSCAFETMTCEADEAFVCQLAG
ncbi:MAG TPA: hypothetical protein VG755_20960 [Nannocystaceae bacterium]|nr:hypothetical protein [Nannocystaceae bacterium]